MIRTSIILALALSLAIHKAYAEYKPTVNILTWSEYLDEPSTAQLVEDKCAATLSYDSYTSNDDMLRRWNASSGKYDVLIFSDTIYNEMKDKIILKNSDIWRKSKDYNPVIRKKYNENHFPHNIAYFFHALTGFIWNPAVINLTKNDTVQTAFKKAKNNKVILIDDPVEINMLLTAKIKDSSGSPDNQISVEHFKSLTQSARTYVSNETNKVYNQKDFAFSYQWSGVAFSDNENMRFRFLINNHLSYVSTDIIAQVKDNKIAACVANLLASKKYLTQLQNRTRYFSPYGNIEAVPEGMFKETYKSFLRNLPQLHWLEPPSTTQLKNQRKKWDQVKYELTKNRE